MQLYIIIFITGSQQIIAVTLLITAAYMPLITAKMIRKMEQTEIE